MLAALDERDVTDIAEGGRDVSALTDKELLEFIMAANLLYRAGEPLIDDGRYDFTYVAELRKRHPEHPFLHRVEPEPLALAKSVELPTRMLSTEKAYDFETITRWATRIEKAAAELGFAFDRLRFRATPKLDGFAAYDDGEKLYTRGDGRRGTDITRAFERGLKVAGTGERGQGAGEIVVSRSYFASHLAALFDNSRNFQASLIKEKELEEPAAQAIDCGAAVFYPFAQLPQWVGGWQELSRDFNDIVDKLWTQLDYDVDGIVFEMTEDAIKEYMGATRHHHRWQIAYKRNTETREVRVIEVVAQTSRSGRVNPVAEIEPTRLSGALIKRATAHHYAMVLAKGIGAGAMIRLSRSGEVIPKIEEVVEPKEVVLPQSCPSCGSDLVWEGDYLTCLNILDCPAQITNSIEHFFKTLGNIDGFGPSSVSRIYQGGTRRIRDIYSLEEQDLVALGFGPKQAQNMVEQLQRSLVEPIEDWRFLAAFGVHRMGMGNCEKLLSVFPLTRVFALTAEEIVEVKGFSDKSADEIIKGFSAVRSEFEALYALGFNLIVTSRQKEGGDRSGAILEGKTVVFTGTMSRGSRSDMQAQAKVLGAKVGSSVTTKTDLLVCGEKVGAAKLQKARTLGVKIVSEQEYLGMVAGAES